MRLLRFLVTSILFGAANVALGQLFPPVAVNDVGNTTEDIATFTLNITDNDTDADILIGAINPASVDLDLVTGGQQTTLLTAAGSFSVDGDGNLTFIPVPDFNGAAVISYTVRDNFNVICNDPGTVTITVDPVNDKPSFATGANQSVLEDAAPQSIANWATSISRGPANESAQVLTFGVTNDNNGLFSVQPAINAAGTLTYTLALNAHGTTTVSVILSDDGGTANGGNDTFETQTFTITATAVNDPPSFIKGSNQTILEDAAGQTIANWATSITKGPADEAAQAIAFAVSNDNNTLFSVQPSISATGTLTYTPAVNANGAATVSVILSDDGGTANGGNDTFTTQTFTITVTAVNDLPSFVKGANQSIMEDASAQSIAGWATSISKGPADEAGQVLTFGVTNDNNTLFSVQPAINAAGTLTYTPALNANGVATVTVVLSDNGGTANGGNDTFTAQTFTIAVTAVNDAPSFAKGADQIVSANAGAQTVAGWATSISKGPADEAGQTLSFGVTNDNNALFSIQPSISTTGTLTYTPAAGADGIATVSVVLSDNGGTANGGDDTFTTETFTITVSTVNQEPSFVKGPNQSILEDAGLQTVVGWATSIDKGSPSESGQVLTFTVTNDNNALFSVQPAVNAVTGTLTYTPAANANGSTTVSVTLSDDGGTANGGDDTSPAQTFTITVAAVNDPPTFVKGADQNVLEDAAAQTVAGWATSVSKGPANESAQVVTFAVTNDNNALFSVQPAVSATGTLTYTLTANASGVATVNVVLSDNGGTTNGGSDAGAAQTFTITATAVNDPPSFVKGVDQNVIENASAQTVAGWATSISKGPADEAAQVLTFGVTNNNNPLFSVQPAISATGTLTYTPAVNTSGTATVSVVLSDNGGTANGGNDSFTLQTFTITVAAINHAPSFVKGPNQTVLEDAAAQTAVAWATAIDKGSPSENGQVLTFALTNDNNALFSVQPAINAATGTLTYALVPNANGIANVSVTLSDNGGTANGGQDTSPVQTFTITVTAVNDPPSFVKGANQNVLEDAVAQTVANWATSVSKGPADETSQVVTFAVTNDNNTLFSAQPVINVSGTLTYTPAANASGSATVSVVLSDNGGTANGGNNTFATQTFVITVTSTNDLPTAVNDATSTNEDTPVSINVTTNDSDGDGSIAANTVDLNTTLGGIQGSVVVTGQGTFSVNSAGLVTFTPVLNFFGTSSVQYTVNDNDGDPSNAATLTITVNPVNDAPVITGQGALVTGEDQSIIIDLGDIVATDVDNTYPTGFSFTVGTGSNYTVSVATITPALNFSGTLTVPVTVNDGAASSASFNLTITVNPVNDSPVIVSQNAVSTSEDLAVTLKFADVNVTDADNTYPAGFTMTIQSGTNYTFSGLVVTPAANFSGTLTIPVSVNDGTSNSNTFNLSVTVTPVNDAPVITGQNALSLNEDQSLTLAFGNLTVTDVDNTYPTGFTLTVLAGSNYTFTGTTITPNANFVGTLTVPVRVNDGTANSNTFNLSVTVNQVNDSPVINSQVAITTNEDMPVTIQFTHINVTDVDNTYPTGFTLNVSGGSNYSVAGTTVTPVANFSGVLTVPVTVNDGASNSNTFNLSITVNSVNDAPVITGQTAISVNEDQSVVVTLGDLTVTDVDNSFPTGFTLTILAGSNYTFSGTTITPSPNFSGTLTVPVRVNDGAVNSANFNLSITVNPINDAPVITGQTALSISEDTPLIIQLSNLIVTDTDNTYPTGFTLTVLAGTNYTFSGNTITPAANFSGTLTVPVRVNDGTANSNIFNLTVIVTPGNDAPVITGQAVLSVNEDSPITIQLANLTVSDPDDTYPTGFTLTVLGGTNYTFSGATVTPSANFSGTLTIPVRVNDGSTDSAPFNLSVTVNPVNDAPSITGQQPLSTNEEQALTIQLSNLLVTDPDNTYPTGFTLTLFAGSNYIFTGTTITPANNFTGTLTVPVRVSDGVSNSNTFNMAVTVNGTNDAPVITGQSPLNVNEDNALTILLSNLIVSDPDNSYPSGFSLTVSAGANYTMSGNTITPAPNFNGVLTVPVTVNDGTSNSATFNLTVTVTPVNDVPQVTGQTPLSTGESQAIVIALSQLFVLDPDDTYPADFSLFVLSGSNYSLVGNVVTPVANFSGLLLVKVIVNDGTANSAIYDLQILVNSVNDPPVIGGQQTLSVNEDSPITIQFANLTVTDPDNTYPTGFTLIVSPGVNYTFSGNIVTPAANFTGTLSVNVKVNDGLSDSAPFNLQINVNPVNDAPQITGQQPLDTNEDTPLTVQFANLIVVDPDNTYPTGFAITILAGSNYTFLGNTITPAANFSGTLTVPVRVNDGIANSSNFNLQVSVHAVNDPPTITGQAALGTAEDAPIVIKLADLTVSDPDDTYPTGFTLTVASGTNYTVSGSTVTPALNFNGTLSVNVTVNDGAANSTSFQLQVLVNAVNTPPTITGQATLAVNEDTPIAIQLANLTVSDPDNTYPNGFSLSLAAGANYIFAGNTVTPASNFSGNLTIPVRVNDGINNSAPFNLLVKVNPVNDPPSITGQSALTINEDQSVTLLLTHLTVSDPDNTFPTGFTLSVNAGTNYTVSGTKVTPNTNFNGNLMVNVTVNDGTDNSAVFQVLVKVNPVNDPPTTSGVAPSVIDEDNTNEIVVSLVNVFSDVEDASGALSYQIMANDNPAYFVTLPAINAAGELRYKVRPNVFGVAKLTVRATDTGGLTVQDILTITINGINDAPSLDPVPNQLAIENQTQKVIPLTNVTKGAFENTQTLNLFATSGNTTIVPNPVITYDGTSSQAQLTFTVQPNKSGTVTITIFAIDDGSNTLPNRNSFSTTFQIDVVEINDSPTINPVSFGPIQEDAPIQSIPLSGITAGPGENQVLTVTTTYNRQDILKAPVIEYVSPQNTGTLKIEPLEDASGTVTVTVKVTDNGAVPTSDFPQHVNSKSISFNMVVQPVNDLPVFKSLPVVEATVDEPYSYSIQVADVDNTSIALTAAQKPSWASLSVSGDGKSGTLTGTPPANAAGTSVVKIQAKDATGAPVIQEFSLHVNTLPTITQVELTTAEDIPLAFQQQKFTAAFTDADTDPIAKIKIVGLPNPDLGSLTFNGASVSIGDEIPFASLTDLIYNPEPEVSGIDTVKWNANDGYRYALKDTIIRITITPANDAPRIDTLENDPLFPLPYDIGSGPQQLTAKFNATEPDTDSLVSVALSFRVQNYDKINDKLEADGTWSEIIQSNFDKETGTLSLTGKASVAQYEDVIRGIKYIYLGESLPVDRVKIVSITLSDGLLPFSETKDRYIELIDEFREIAIVNGFTPNGDTQNEKWISIPEVREVEFPEAELKVYDKRGRLLFETKGFAEHWDGTYKGEPLPTDSYFFTLDLKLPFIKKTYKGVVTILR